MTINEARKYGKETLEKSKRTSTARLDCDVILMNICSCTKTDLLFHGENILSDEQLNLFNSAIEKRCTGFPVAYITGTKEFFGYDFIVSPHVLIPKPDTELLVETAIDVIENMNKKNNSLEILDMCTGSGCIGISVMKYIDENNLVDKEFLPKIILADISIQALNIAKENAKKLLSEKAYSKIEFVQTNLFENLGETKAGRFDIILSNPPYIPYSEVQELLKDGRSEPSLALIGDVDSKGNITDSNDGLDIIKKLIPQSYRYLVKGGVLIVESGEYNARQTEELFIQAGFKNTKILLDMNDQLRDTIGYKI